MIIYKNSFGGSMSNKILALFGCLALLLPAMAQTPSGRDYLNEGVREFKADRFPQAVEDFRQAVAADPDNANAHLYLGMRLYMQYVPGAQATENLQFAEGARTKFEKVLALDPGNVLATSSIAALYYHMEKFPEAEDWNQKVIAIDPNNKEAYYTLGVLAWRQWLPEDRKARADSNQGPADPGPIGNAAIREQLKVKWMPVLDEGISKVDKALQLDPTYDDAMAYMNLLIRYRADLLDTSAEWSAASAKADEWMQRALDTKRARAAAGPPPLPTQPATQAGLRVGAEVLGANLISKVDPVYPPLALSARISGTVRFKVTVGVDGRVKNFQLVSGHPLLVQAAKDALAGYVYKPTLLNGNPVEVTGTVEVPFVLNP
jgi:TonB family protein